MTSVATRSELTLRAETAADLMVANPVSIREDASVAEAVALFATRGFGAAPVIDDAGWPVGVISHSDVIVHDHARKVWGPPSVDYFRSDEPTSAQPRATVPDNTAAPPCVRDLMTPAVFSVSADTPAARVVREMLGLRVHRLFVVDDNGVLVGVISALDILRRLRE